jgi:hypothetical protein
MEEQTKFGTGAASGIALVALLEPHIFEPYPKTTAAIYIVLCLVMIWAFAPIIARLFRKLIRRKSAKAPEPFVLSEISAEIEAFCNSWLWEAASGADQILRFVTTEVYRHPDPAVRNQAGLIQKAIIDEERTALILVQNALRGLEPTTDDDLQDRLGKYYRAYQSCRTWIAMGAQSANIPVGKNVVYQAWLKSDKQFLIEIRRFAGPPKFNRLRREIAAVGFGDGITLELDKLSNLKSDPAPPVPTPSQQGTRGKRKL